MGLWLINEANIGSDYGDLRILNRKKLGFDWDERGVFVFGGRRERGRLCGLRAWGLEGVWKVLMHRKRGKLS